MNHWYNCSHTRNRLGFELVVHSLDCCIEAQKGIGNKVLAAFAAEHNNCHNTVADHTVVGHYQCTQNTVDIAGRNKHNSAVALVADKPTKTSPDCTPESAYWPTAPRSFPSKQYPANR